MNIEAAKLSLDIGQMIAHNFFKPHEYIILKDGKIEDQDGNQTDPKIYWTAREGKLWKDDWEIILPTDTSGAKLYILCCMITETLDEMEGLKVDKREIKHHSKGLMKGLERVINLSPNISPTMGALVTKCLNTLEKSISEEL